MTGDPLCHVCHGTGYFHAPKPHKGSTFRYCDCAKNIAERKDPMLSPESLRKLALVLTCLNCGHSATVHTVDDEERAGCEECGCEGFASGEDARCPGCFGRYAETDKHTCVPKED